MSEQAEKTDEFRCWAILELLGHRRLGGYVTTQEIASAAFIRIDIPGPDDSTVTQFYNPSALYGLTPTTEELARAAAKSSPAPIARWELPQSWQDAIGEHEAAKRRAAITTGMGEQYGQEVRAVMNGGDIDDVPY